MKLKAMTNVYLEPKNKDKIDPNEDIGCCKITIQLYIYIIINLIRHIVWILIVAHLGDLPSLFSSAITLQYSMASPLLDNLSDDCINGYINILLKGSLWDSSEMA